MGIDKKCECLGCERMKAAGLRDVWSFLAWTCMFESSGHAGDEAAWGTMTAGRVTVFWSEAT
jgi:hypothetical protein